MDLVIKPTERCNFNCSFCSSPKKLETEEVDVNKVLYFLDCYPETRTIIVNGGDPLMMDPKYYFDILHHIEDQELQTTLCLMTNLWGFYQYPEKWKELFQARNVKVGTSFQYGEGRRTMTGPFTEDLFRKVITKFEDYIGYTPMFIAVINEDNEDTVIKTIELAKELKTVCKINPMFKSGRASNPYPLYKMYKNYLHIIDKGLDKYEQNSTNLKNFSSGTTTCSMPFNKQMCDQGIRCIGPRNEYHSCPAINDDHYDDYNRMKFTYELNFEADMKEQRLNRLNTIYLMSLKPECLECPLYKLCNNCAKHVKDYKEMGEEFIEEHCNGMKEQQEELEKYL